MKTNFSKNLFLTAIIALVLPLTACNTVNISMQKPKQYLIDGRANIITSGQLSNNSMGMLRMAGTENKTCLADLPKCLNELDNNQFVKYTPRQLALYAELHYAKAQELQETKDCKKKKPSLACINNYQQQLLEAIRYSYAYLFFYKNHNQQSHFTNELDIQMQDIYHTASKNLIDKLSSQVINHNQQHIKINNYKINVILPNHLLQKLDNKKSLPIDSLIATSTLKMTGLNSVSTRHGIGVSYVAQKSNRHTNNIKQTILEDIRKNILDDNINNNNQIQERIYPTGNLLLTAIMQPQGNDIESILTTNNFALQLYDPYQTQNVTIHNHSYPLATNFSANYALWINENQLRQVSIMNMLRNDKGVPLPQLYMLEPYNPNKRIIIMVHGLASSPFTWVNLTNDLLNDERLRENYQVWQVFYATNLPMLENRYYIQQLIEQAYQQTVGTTQVPASQHSVIIAHSMGSVISRMMLSNDNLNEKNIFKNKKLSQNHQQKLQLNPLSSVDTAVFISAPFRGTNFADRWFTKALRDVIKLPTELTKKKSANPIINELFLQDGASQLSDKSAFMQLTKDIAIHKNVTYHNIVGDYEGVLNVVNRRSSQHKNSDGIVPYNSSHLEGAKSETVIKGGHDIHTNPKTILQLRKILHQQLAIN